MDDRIKNKKLNIEYKAEIVKIQNMYYEIEIQKLRYEIGGYFVINSDRLYIISNTKCG